MAQIEALKRDLKKGRKGDEGIGADGSSGNVELDELRRELNDAREKEVGAPATHARHVSASYSSCAQLSLSSGQGKQTA